MKRRQTGALLLVALVVLLVLTLLSLLGIRLVQLEVRLTGIRAEQLRAFNAAESALREGERRLAGIDGAEDGRSTACSPGQPLCVLSLAQVRTIDAGRWSWQWRADWREWWGNSRHALDYRGTDGLSRLDPAPRLHAVFVASAGDINLQNHGEAALRTDFYFVDAYADSDAGRTPVLLQTVYARRYMD